MTIRARWYTAHARRWLRTCATVGDKPYLAGKPTIGIDGGQVIIGHRFRLSSRPVTSHLIAGPDAVLRIGNDVSIGSGAAVAAFHRVYIGGPYADRPVLDNHGHEFFAKLGDQSFQHQCLPVTIGDRCR